MTDPFEVSHETIRAWEFRFAPLVSEKLLVNDLPPDLAPVFAPAGGLEIRVHPAASAPVNLVLANWD